MRGFMSFKVYTCHWIRVLVDGDGPQEPLFSQSRLLRESIFGPLHTLNLSLYDKNLTSRSSYATYLIRVSHPLVAPCQPDPPTPPYSVPSLLPHRQLPSVSLIAALILPLLQGARRREAGSHHPLYSCRQQKTRQSELDSATFEWRTRDGLSVNDVRTFAAGTS